MTSLRASLVKLGLAATLLATVSAPAAAARRVSILKSRDTGATATWIVPLPPSELGSGCVARVTINVQRSLSVTWDTTTRRVTRAEPTELFDLAITREFDPTDPLAECTPGTIFTGTADPDLFRVIGNAAAILRFAGTIESFDEFAPDFVDADIRLRWSGVGPATVTSPPAERSCDETGTCFLVKTRLTVRNAVVRGELSGVVNGDVVDVSPGDTVEFATFSRFDLLSIELAH